ncbi:hypothetical protein I204_01329 [Kwoniella mangroviensis CBS 8886]|uniref:uncharacterized protein n=1 Tax=Kwoniella mangroviensis CBS 8507 TaxID=1296122 RepID=UPI00080D725A|nr:uncharacterized protein I203_06104 [Kwoniella mangroviensis CBS 8507]OCF64860.1 hypothetical protein I203_06104 [Kwoniella mangroviensis CBS 8507]OCF77341.1 hypothetical protein I204_01329 [Kwoniella mangroviensis CBS 8886]
MSSLLEESHEVIPPTTSSSSTNPPPIPSFQLRQSICNVDTELLIQTFDDRVLAIVTQNGKVGCLTQASLPPHIPLPPPPKPSSKSINGDSSPLDILEILPTPSPSLTLTPLLGSPPNPTLYELHITQIATLIFWALEISGQGRRNVVVGLSLRTQRQTSEGQDEDDGEVLDEDERLRYAGIMDLVSQWSGPSE